MTLPKINPEQLRMPITIAEMATAMGLGPNGDRRLRRYLLQRERSLGTQFLIRGLGAAYRVTLPILRQHAPELLDERSPRDRLAEHVAEIDAAIIDLVGRVTALETRR